MKKSPNKKPYALSPEQYVEYALCNLEKTNKKIRSFHKNFQTYLATQRKLLESEILTSLKKNSKKNINACFYRVVLAKYMNDPLCMIGSLLYSGRFHFGNIDYDYKSFPCLYVSSSSEGAKFEKFPNTTNQSLLSSEEMSLVSPKNSFLTSRCEMNLTKCMDLREIQNLKDFTQIISKIYLPENFQKKWKKVNRQIYNNKNKKIDRLKIIKSTNELYRSLFEVHYQQWITWLDIPSNSQWFGYYVKKAGIEAIIYPSLRYDCYNLAVYPENFEEKSYIRLIDIHESVPKDRMEINKKNYKFFEMEAPSKNSFIQ